MRRNIAKDSKGFTVVELLIATAIFSLVLLVCSYAIVHVGRMYYKGLITNRTQDTARTLVEDIANAIQFGSNNADQFLVPDDPSNLDDTLVDNNNVPRYAYCIGGVRYSFTTERYLEGGAGANANHSRHVVWKDRVNSGESCEPRNLAAADPGGDGEEMVAGKMRVPRLTVTQNGDVYTVTVRVAFGDDVTLFEDDNPLNACRGVIAGGQFCAVSEFSTSVSRRLN